MQIGRQCRPALHGAQPRSLLALPTRRCRTTRVYAAAAEPTEKPSFARQSIDLSIEADEPPSKAFPYPLPMDPQQKVLSSIPLPLFYPAMLAAVAGTAFAGSLLGRATPVEPENKDIASYSLAAVAGVGAAYVAVQAKKKRDSAAVVDLYNTIVELPDAAELTADKVAEVGARFGLSMQRDQLDGLKKIYGQFLESLIPLGDTQLKGYEADQVRAFKDALGLDDEDAAPVHIEVGRRFNRDGFETKDRTALFEKRKAFQRLIYVSQVVFGDQKAAFLLPWRRHFNLNEAQLFVARRDNARAVFRQIMEARGGVLVAERHFLNDLRQEQLRVKLLDETAEEVIKEYARRYIEARLQKAIDIMRSGTGKSRDSGQVVEEVNAVLEYSRKLVRLANEEGLIPGLGQVTIAGGPLAAEGKGRDIKDAYRLYLDERMSAAGEISPQLEADAKELSVILNLGAKEAQTVQDEIAAKLYRRLLKEEVVSGRLDAAASPATVLQVLCDRVRFSPEGAMELHKTLYKQKLESLLEKKKLTDADAEDLKRIRRILCITSDVAKKALRETAGRDLEEVISDVYLMGAKPLSDFEAERVEKVMKDLRIDTDVALEVMTKVTRERLRAYVTQAQKEKDRKDFTGTVKKMLQFNALAVTPLLERVKGTAAAMKELAEVMKQATEAAAKEDAASQTIDVKPTEDTVSQVRKAIQANRGEMTEDEKRAQKEITLRDDVDPKVRAEIYKNFLMSSMSGDFVELPVGGTIRKKTSTATRQAEMARLGALADVLGMTQIEVVQVQQDMAEQAYKQQATEIMRTGPMNEEKLAYLEEMRNSLGLQKDAAERLTKAARTEAYGSAAAAEDGKWSLDKVLELHDKGASVEGLIEEVTRRNLFRKELITKVQDGAAEATPEWFLKRLPAALALPEFKVKQIVKEEVQARKRMLLVQAVSQYRQKRYNEVALSLNNLVSCWRLLPDAQPMPWREREELKEVFSIYCTKEEGAARRTAVQQVLGLSDTEAEEAQLVSTGAGGSRKDDDDAFF